MDLSRFQSAVKSDARSYDLGLRDFMIGVYNNMFIGIAITAIVALLVSSSASFMQLIHATPLKYVIMFAPFGMVMFFSFKINSAAYSTLKGVFYGYAALMGAMLSYIFIVYTGASIVRTLFITASMFGAMSLWGYTTKKDLTSMGSFLFMGLIGIVIMSLVNLFMKSSAIHFMVSFLAIIIFVGLTAYETQSLKATYQRYGNSESTKRVGLMGALNLYMSFLNIFIHLLQFIGDRK
ncbi:MAG: Bax inhibitor-1/YccA family protein [Rickettsiales bacterium]|nr:Bax inhibitor-1/YccA family protein [Rickettsiales bacterium]